MTAKYYVTLTDYGASLVAETHDNASIHLTAMVLGDANNQPYDPINQTTRTSLVNQRATVPIQNIEILEDVTRISSTIGVEIGGFNIHEYGYTDQTGKLVYIANYHGNYKPVIEEGAGGELEIVTDIKANAGAQVLIAIDPNVVSANKTWVQKQINELKEALLLEIKSAAEDVEIGDLFLTTLYFADEDAVKAHKKFGVWRRYGDGQALVIQASESNLLAPNFMRNMGHIGGEYKHQQTLEELVGHKHSQGDVFNKFVARASDIAGTDLVTRTDISPQHDNDNPDLEIATGYFSQKGWELSMEQETGGNSAFNIVQTSIIIGAWLRIE